VRPMGNFGEVLTRSRRAVFRSAAGFGRLANHETSMKTRKLEKPASSIADAIVEFVERVGGPVALARIEREIPGFAAQGRRTWIYEIEGGDGEDGALIWDGMSKAGSAALGSILTERRVAIQMAPRLVYRLEGRYPIDENWVPIALLPASMANLEGPRLLIRGSQAVLDECMARAAAEQLDGFRVLGPGS
jgi:hypothetical protein